jgi:hypothetical protein
VEVSAVEVAEVAEQMAGLRHRVEAIEGLLDPSRSEPVLVAAGAPSPGAPRRGEWYERVEDAVLELSGALPERIEDYDARKLLEFLVELRRAIDADDGATDPRGEVELAALKMRDVTRRIARRLEHNELDDPRAAAASVLATLRGVGVGDLSRLLGVSTKTVNAWRAGRPVTRNTGRVVLLAQLLTYLRASMTPVGLMLWFDAPREQLGGRTPLDVLDAGEAPAHELLVSLARGARAQLAG